MRRKDNGAKPKSKPRSSSKVPYVWGIVFLGIGAFLFLALLSYNHFDPSLLTRTHRITGNLGGPIGANLAELLIQGFGLASFLLVVCFLNLSYRAFLKESVARALGSTALQIIAILTLSTLLGIQFGHMHFGGAYISSGGFCGERLGSLAVHFFNVWGATLLSLCLLLVALVYALPESLILRTASLTAHGARKLFHTVGAMIHAIEFRRTGFARLAQAAAALKPALEPLVRAPEIAVAPLAKSTTEIIPRKEIAKDSGFKISPAAARPTPKASASAKKGDYQLPSLDLLKTPPAIHTEIDKDRLMENSKILETKLIDFGIEGEVTAVRPGPVITMYEFKPGPGVKISQIAALADDLSLALSAQSVRIVAPIPGKSVVGIEIPNEEREKVPLKEILSTNEFQGSEMQIPLAVGKDISGTPITADLARMPHLLIAGAPGAGKSVFINSLICSLLYKFTPNEMRMIMVDPKQLELNLYEGIPHLLLPVVDDPKKASTALRWAVNEMERRYKIMARAGVRNLQGFNQKLEADGRAKLATELCPKDAAGMPLPISLAHLFDHDEKGEPVVEPFPFLLVIIDEFADLMMVAPKDIEISVARLAQKARAAGIHLVIATQRPSVDVITGLIKANLPSRISFQVSSKIDSRTILDSMGAEKLLGQGDMLFIPPGLSRLVRLHGAFVTEEEIAAIHTHWTSQGAPVYREEILVEPAEDEEGDEADGAGDALYSQAVSIVREMGQASASMIQRRLKVGYNRAARMVEAMEAQGIVGPADGSRPREVIY